MAQLVLECPHCRAEKIGFAPRGFAPLKPGNSNSQTLLFLQCEGCGDGVFAVLDHPPAYASGWIGGSGSTPGNITRSYPQPTALKAPADVPPNVQSTYLSGLDNLGRKNGANAAGAMFRRAIDLAARAIDKDAPKDINLKQRIERLPDNLVTPSMKEWAHHIRLEGNDAVHEPEEYSEKDAAQLRAFAELFLTYAFTLPEMLRKAKEPPPAPAAPPAPGGR